MDGAVSVRVSAVALAVAMAIAVPAIAQQPAGPSLAEIAREAEAAKTTTKKAKKSYTNASLGADALPPPAPAAPPTGYVSKTLDKPVSPEEILQRSEQQVEAQAKAEAPTEEHWRKRAERIRSDVDGAQGRLSRLLGRPENPNPTLQQRAEKEIAAIRTGMNTLRTQWTALEQEARDAKIDLSWLGSAPQFRE